ncbi:hypothetical protein PV327_001168 [Microctonus hyperodae]|uniref:Uncharacterized protein n=1 Tax=Microctonus hyperodae TaxID=165561 RepID=A0AA39L2P5_MICHY|nr:hypothetical protein PV327_001168 [Microctonus hyperodae]
MLKMLFILFLFIHKIKAKKLNLFNEQNYGKNDQKKKTIRIPSRFYEKINNKINKNIQLALNKDSVPRDFSFVLRTKVIITVSVSRGTNENETDLPVFVKNKEININVKN